MTMFRRALALAFLLLAVPVPALAAGPAHLVADLNPGTDPFSANSALINFDSYAEVGGRAVFFGFLEEGSPFLSAFQCGLWVTDGTAGGTERLADLCGEAEDLNGRRPRMLATTGAVALFTDFPGRLWRTDGTAAGTYPLSNVQAGNEFSLGPDGRTLLFQGCTPARGCEPWRSDGTRQGTALLRDLVTGKGSSSPYGFTRDGGRVLFVATGGLWSTDGTAAGTARLIQISADPALYPLGKPLPHGGLIYFFVFTPSLDLWVYDPVTHKARKLHSFPSDFLYHAGANLVEVGERLLIRQYDTESAGDSLWETDGTRAGTRQLGPPFKFGGVGIPHDVDGRAVFPANRAPQPVLELWSLAPGMKRPLPLRGCPGGCPSLDSGDFPATVFAGRLYFAGRDAQHGRELWSTDGTGAGTRLVADLCPGTCDGGPTRFRAALGRLVLSDPQGDLWATDGTPAGTVRLAATGGAFSTNQPLDLATLAGRIVFTGLDAAEGLQPFASDLTPGGTEPITAIGPGLAASSLPSGLSPSGGKLLFEACSPSTGGLWSSDGTAAGTILLPGTELPCEVGRLPKIFQWIGDIALFNWKGKLWRTDGTAAGTIPLLDLPTQPFVRSEVVLGSRLFFVLDPSADTPPSTTGYDWTFWTSDGTPGGTRELFSRHFGATPDPLVAVGGLAYFTAASATAPFPYSLWRTDGTDAGTFPILNGTGGGGFGPESAQLGGKTWLILNTTRDPGYEIWSTDGTDAGTAPLLPDTTGPRPRNPYSLVAFQGALYFWAESGDPAHPIHELWRSDGTAAGTRLLKTIDPPRSEHVLGGFLLPQLTPAGNQLFFRADDGVHGPELWKTDGTPEGTVLVKDLAPGPATSRIDGLTAAGGQLYFSATDGGHGDELWQSDGTAAGTVLVQDVQPGPAPSNPQQLTAGDGVLYFTANDGEHGRELWALPLPR